jgi:Uma2 family endonuclease
LQHRSYWVGLGADREVSFMSATRLMTADDLLQLPDDGLRHELVAGELIDMAPANALHSVIALELGARLRNYVQVHNQGAIFGADAGFLIARDPDTVRAPDVAFVTQERIARIGLPEQYFPGPPDLAVEVISPSERRAEIDAKVADYLRAGTQMVWVVEPTTRSVTVHEPNSAPRRLSAADTLDAGLLIPGLALPVGEFFPTLPQSGPAPQ